MRCLEISVTSHGRHGASDRWQLDCLFDSLFSRTIKDILKLRIAGPLNGDQWISSQRAGNAGNVEKFLMAWASYQIHKIAGCACAGNAGNVSPRRRFKRKPLVSDPGMHHGTCVTHVPWCMSGSLTCGDGENVPGIPGACAPAILRIWQEAHAAMWTLTQAIKIQNGTKCNAICKSPSRSIIIGSMPLLIMSGVGEAVRFLVVRKDHHGANSGWSSVWHRSNTGVSSTQYEQIPIILGVWPFGWLPSSFDQ